MRSESYWNEERELLECRAWAIGMIISTVMECGETSRTTITCTLVIKR